MKLLRVVTRLVHVVLHVLQGWLTIAARFGSATAAQRQAYVQAWAKRFVAILGARLVVHGNPSPSADQGLLLVANHISWLDILVLLAVRPVRFVSKSEVAHWPVIGLMATGAGTLYIERASKRDALRVMHQMADALKSGDCVGVFPEGTTGDGTTLLPFHANLLQAGISAHVPALPVAISFIDPITGGISQAASYLGDDTLLGSMWKLLSSDPIDVRLHFLPPHSGEGSDRRAWSEALRQELVTAHAEMIASEPNS